MTARRLFSWLLWRTGAAAAIRRMLASGGRFAVIFHGVASGEYSDLPRAVQPSFTAAALRDAVTWIAGRFRLLTPDEFLAGRAAGVLLTFDDGFANNASQALPVLEELDAPAVFFVTARHVREPRDWLPATRELVRAHWHAERPVPEEVARDLFDGMSRQQLALCAEHPLVTIGSHTVGHPFLTRCDDATLRDELEGSRDLLQTWCGRTVDLFAYPTGDYDLRVARAARGAGYRAAFAQDPAGIGLPAYEIPRIGLYAADSPYLAAKLSGLHRRALPLGEVFGGGDVDEQNAGDTRR